MNKIYTVERPASAPVGKPPLLLLLHGFGSNERDLMELAPYLDRRWYIMSARAIYDISMALGGPAYAWYYMYGVPGNLQADTVSRARSLEVLTKFVASLPERVGVDPQRVYLMGFSQGAVMSLALALQSPQLVAGVVAMSGYLAEEALTSLQPAALAHLKLLVMHGTQDEVVPVTLGRRIEEYLQGLPVDLDFTYREYSIGHAIHPQGLTLVQQWLREQLDGPQGQPGPAD